MSESIVCNQREETTAEKLGLMKLEEIMTLFRSLEAPSFEEMEGEYDAFLLDHGDPITNLISVLSMSNPLTTGRWAGKAFTAEYEHYGHGYNLFEKFGKTKRKLRMRTEIGVSRFDQKPSFILDYTAYDSMLGILNTVDEIRKVGENIYLGVGTWGFTKKQRLKPLPFCLQGPKHPFVGVD